MAYVKEMLGGQEVPQEVFAALSGKHIRNTYSHDSALTASPGGPGIATGVPSIGGFDDDTDYEGDDEDLMRDPIVQVDMQASVVDSRSWYPGTHLVLQAHIVSFIRDAASGNSPEFASVIGQLKPEEVQVVRKVVGA